MARVKDVVQRDMPEAPGGYTTKKSALAADPEHPIADARFSTQEKAKNAAYRVNDGKREEWPVDKYFAIYAANPHPQELNEDGSYEDAWELLIVSRANGVPAGWQREVNAPGSRRRNRQTESSEHDEPNSDAADEVSDDQEQVEQESEQQEPVAA